MAEPLYRQYVLVKQLGPASSTLTTWLPEKHKGHALEIGTCLALHGLDGIWKVHEVGTHTRSKAACEQAAHRWTLYMNKVDI